MFFPKMVKLLLLVAFACNIGFAMNKKTAQDYLADQKACIKEQDSIHKAVMEGKIAAEEAAQLRHQNQAKLAQATDLALKQIARESEEALQKLKKMNEDLLQAQDAQFEQFLASINEPNKSAADIAKALEKTFGK